MHTEVIIAGFGGQGILLMGRLLAHAGMLEGKEVTWFPSYGAEIRGGTANCTVIISDNKIASPIIRHPSSIIVMNNASLIRFERMIRPRGYIFLNSSLIDVPPVKDDVEVVSVPANEIAEKVGDARTANMVMIGAFIEKTGILSTEKLLEAFRDIIPEGKEKLYQLDKEALLKGMEIIGIRR